MKENELEIFYKIDQFYYIACMQIINKLYMLEKRDILCLIHIPFDYINLDDRFTTKMCSVLFEMLKLYNIESDGILVMAGRFK